MRIRSMLFALAVLLGTTGAALADPITALVTAAVTAISSAVTVASVTSFLLSSAAVGGGLFTRRRKP